MFEAWGRFVYRRRRLVLLVAAVAVVGAALWGTGVFGALQSGGGLTERVGGQIPTELAINEEVKADIGRAEGISMPALLILLLVIFGSLAAASMPLAIGAIGILGSFAALRLLTLVTDVSIYSINI